MATQSLHFQGMELLIAYYRNPSIKLRNQLVQLHTGLVRKIAYKISRQCREPYEDLQQIGFIGLIRAIERFNPQQGCAFSSFAIPYIRGEILHFLRDRGSLVKIPRRWYEIQREGRKVSKELTLSLGRIPTDAEIAQALQLSLKLWQESKTVTHNCFPLSLDATVSNVVDCATTFGDTITDPQEEAWRHREEERQQLQGAMSQLDEKTQAAIEFVYIWDLSRQEVAQKIGVSPITVSRYVQRGVNQLVSLLQSPNSEKLAS
jgi:RNA polymerase sigma-B factor